MELDIINKDPNEVIYHAINFGPMLAGGDGIETTTLSSVTWSADDGITATHQASDTQYGVVELSGGTAKQRYRVRGIGVTADGQTIYQSFYVWVEEL